MAVNRRGPAGARWLVGALLAACLAATGVAPAEISFRETARPPRRAPLRDFSFSLPLFAVGSAWNQSAANVAVLADSDQQILVTYRVLCGDSTTLSSGTFTPEWPFPDVNYDDYSISIARMGSGTQNVKLCDYEGVPGWTSPKISCATAGCTVSVPAPAGQIRPAGPMDTGADGHLVLYNPATLMAYDFWNATTARDGVCQSQGGGLTGTAVLEAGTIDYFDVRGSGANPDTYFSARATGTPLLAGLILPEDVESGAIRHALAFAIPGLRNTASDPYEPLPADYFYPTSTTETDFYNTSPYAIAAGQRIRLRETLVDESNVPVDESSLAPITRMFLDALRQYGAYAVDNAGGFTFYAEDIHTAVLDLTISEVETLIGGTMPGGVSKWEAVITTLNQELEGLPFAAGSWTSGQDPTTATVTTSNFDVVAPASYLEILVASRPRALPSAPARR
jgi:hypothetical protein